MSKNEKPIGLADLGKIFGHVPDNLTQGATSPHVPHQNPPSEISISPIPLPPPPDIDEGRDKSKMEKEMEQYSNALIEAEQRANELEMRLGAISSVHETEVVRLGSQIAAAHSILTNRRERLQDAMHICRNCKIW
jgi:hypothetical protein